jgi:hypothetical protein
MSQTSTRFRSFILLETACSCPYLGYPNLAPASPLRQVRSDLLDWSLHFWLVVSTWVCVVVPTALGRADCVVHLELGLH